MTAIVALLGGVRGTVFAGLALVLGVLLWITGARLDRAQERADLWQQAAQGYVAANATNVHTIDKLKTANAEWAEKYRADLALSEAAVAAVASERDALEAALQQARRDREAVYETDPSAAAWSRTRIPAAVADSLRD